MTARNVARTVVLEPEQGAQLQSLSTSRSLPHALVTRARVILMAADGVENIVIAERVGLSRLSVGKWRQRFAQYGVEGLHDELRPGRPRTIEDERIAKLINQTLRSQPKNATHWTTRLSAKHAKISKSTVQRIWNVFGLRPHRHRAFKLSNDPFFIEKVRDIVGLYLNPPQNALVLCVDEKSQCQALERTQPVLPMGLGYVEGITHDYVRHGTTTLFAALNIASGKVIGKCQRQHRHQEFLKFLNHIDTNVPATLDLHLIMDNYASHKHPKVGSWLAQHPRYHVHFTPTYSSWLNQVERWFALITQRAIRRGSFRSIKDLVARIDQFVQHYNRNCRPFCWTATAESILAKLERLCIAISGTAH
ncbi:MAG TPA: IS630 family transposase [Candidatus Binatia bacterium]|nr:IS630 family transposase [Candidatus Binatia bacterium]